MSIYPESVQKREIERKKLKLSAKCPSYQSSTLSEKVTSVPVNIDNIVNLAGSMHELAITNALVLGTFVYMSVRPSVRLFVRPPVRLSLFLSVRPPFVCLSVLLSKFKGSNGNFYLFLILTEKKITLLQ